MAQNFLSGTVSTAIDTQRVLEVKILNRLNAMSAGSGSGGAGVVGIGSPEGVVTAPAGTSYFDTSADSFWYKESGSGSTGWTQLIA